MINASFIGRKFNFNFALANAKMPNKRKRGRHFKTRTSCSNS